MTVSLPSPPPSANISTYEIFAFFVYTNYDIVQTSVLKFVIANSIHKAALFPFALFRCYVMGITLVGNEAS